MSTGEPTSDFKTYVQVLLEAEQPSIVLGSRLPCTISFRLSSESKGPRSVEYELDYSQSGWMVAGETMGMVTFEEAGSTIKKTIDLVPLRKGDLALPLVQLSNVSAEQLILRSIPPIITVTGPQGKGNSAPLHPSVTYCMP